MTTDSTKKWQRRWSNNTTPSVSLSLSFHSNSSSSCSSEEFYYYNLSPLITPKSDHNQLSSSTKASVPFSWEYLPGIPKNSTIRPPQTPPLLAKPITPHHSEFTPTVKKPKSFNFSLPLPPSTPASSSMHDDTRKQSTQNVANAGIVRRLETIGSSRGISISSTWRDPFIAALIECSGPGDATNGDGCGNNNRCRSDRKSGSKSNMFPLMSLIGLDQFSCKRNCDVAEYSIVKLRRSTRLAYYDMDSS